MEQLRRNYADYAEITQKLSRLCTNYAEITDCQWELRTGRIGISKARALARPGGGRHSGSVTVSEPEGHTASLRPVTSPGRHRKESHSVAGTFKFRVNAVPQCRGTGRLRGPARGRGRRLLATNQCLRLPVSNLNRVCQGPSLRAGPLCHGPGRVTRLP